MTDATTVEGARTMLSCGNAPMLGALAPGTCTSAACAFLFMLASYVGHVISESGAASAFYARRDKQNLQGFRSRTVAIVWTATTYGRNRIMILQSDALCAVSKTTRWRSLSAVTILNGVDVASLCALHVLRCMGWLSV